MGTSATPGTGAADSAPNEGQDGTGAGNEQPGGQNGAPTPAGGAGGLDRSKLSPYLQNASESEINELFGVLLNSVPRGDQLGAPAHARQPEPPAQPEVKAPSRDELREMLDPSSDKFNPETALHQFVEANYGSLLGDVTKRANLAIKNKMATELPDFKQYEADIDAYLGGVDPRLVNENTYMQAYFTVKGLKQTQKEIADRKRPATTMEPTPTVNEDPRQSLSKEEEAVARQMFPNSKDLAKDFRRAQAMTSEGFSVRVPGDK